MGSLWKGVAMTKLRRRVKHTLTFEERLSQEARKFNEAAEREPPGSMSRELLLRRARKAEAASRINGWLSSPVFQSPKHS
jgi:hypothetical protein